MMSVVRRSIFSCLVVLPGFVNAGEYGSPVKDIAKHLDNLVRSYPDHLLRHDGKVLFWKDGTRMQISDGRTDKSFSELLNSPDLDDMFIFPYPAGEKPAAPSRNHDPGRVRYQPFFDKIYGNCKKRKIVTTKVTWLKNTRPQTLRVTGMNNVAAALNQVSRELENLPRKYQKYLTPSAGTYNCRNISGTARLSVHSYAAAIDINVKKSNYWKWSKPGKNGIYKWQNQIPFEIVKIFEKHGFIWGGRWYHYDTMHFEYRPELTIR